MAKNYIPKTDPLSINRIKKIAKDLITESAEDRKLALEAHRFFRQMVDENGTDSTAKSLMVDALKVAQASKNNVIKIMGLVIKMEDNVASKETSKASGGAPNALFNDLDNLTD